jgi:hypothetical protein
MTRWLLALILITACSAPQPKFTDSTPPPTIQAAVKYFEEIYDIHIPFDVKPTDTLPIHVLGSALGCGSYGVQISDIFLMIASDDSLEEVVFHELGHCVFGRPHLEGVFTSGTMKGCAMSVMMSKENLQSYNGCWQHFKEYYIDELAKPGMCDKDYAYQGKCDIRYKKPKYFPSRKTLRFYMGNK